MSLPLSECPAYVHSSDRIHHVMIMDKEDTVETPSSPATVTMNRSTLHKRRDSNASENDFFDIPDEPIASILKRQFRRKRVWIIFGLILLLLKWLRRDDPPDPSLPHIRYDKVNWSRYAYTQYATSEAYLCNSVMVFETLHRLGSRADRVLFYPEEWDLIMEGEYARSGQLLVLAKEKYNVQLMAVKMEGINKEPGALFVFHLRQ